MGFLNIDLDLESEHDLSPLLKAWAGRVALMRNKLSAGRHQVSIATGQVGVDAVLQGYAALVSGLGEVERQLWSGARERVFDFGFACEEGAAQCQIALSEQQVQRVAELGGRLVVTLYLDKQGAY